MWARIVIIGTRSRDKFQTLADLTRSPRDVPKFIGRLRTASLLHYTLITPAPPVTMDPSGNPLTHEEVWDDSMLVNAWNEAVQEYQVSPDWKKRASQI